jgi:hypothetical protein
LGDVRVSADGIVHFKAAGFSPRRPEGLMMFRPYVLSFAAMFSCATAFAGVVNTVTDTTPTGATTDGTVNGGEYVGTVSGGGSGFGGPVGGATLSVDSDASGVYFGFSNLGNFGGNSIRVYFDTVAGGNTTLSDGAGFNDFADFGRERLSRPASNGLTLPFQADYGLIISDAFGGFQANFQLVPGGNNSLVPSNTGNIYTDPDVGDNGVESTVENFISYSNLGITPGSIVDFVVIYANNNDQDSAFMSDESFPFQIGGGNPGNGPVTLTDFHRLQTYVPEPGSIALLGIAGLGLLKRRRTR